jgi:isopenicillin-N N-acyltransferase-like protein
VGATYPHVRVEGGPLERGRQYGEATRDRVCLSVEAYREVFGHLTGWSWERVLEEARPYEVPIAAYGRKYVEEMQGIAAGAGLSFDDVLAINVRTEVMFSARARLASGLAGGAPSECSSFAVLPQASASGSTLVGQNWDWLPHSFETVVVLEAEQDEGPDFVTVVEAGLLAKTGLNSAGIGLVTNALVTDADRGEPGVPYHVVLRAILDAETIADALAAIQRQPRSSSAGYLVAHEDGLAAYVEGAPGDFSQLFLLFPERGVLLHTNHFVSPSFAGKDVMIWASPDSPFRLERLRSLVENAERLLTVETFTAALADHAGHPFGVCCHPDRRAAPVDQSATIASVVMELDRRRVWVADGPPCAAEYRELDYGEFLSKRPSVRPAESLA